MGLAMCPVQNFEGVGHLDVTKETGRYISPDPTKRGRFEAVFSLAWRFEFSNGGSNFKVFGAPIRSRSDNAAAELLGTYLLITSPV